MLWSEVRSRRLISRFRLKRTSFQRMERAEATRTSFIIAERRKDEALKGAQPCVSGVAVNTGDGCTIP